MIRSDSDMYKYLDEVFEAAKGPLTCVDLMDNPNVRAEAINRWGKDIQYATEKLSDMLGYMWKKNVLDRYPYAGTRTRARYCYTKKDAPAVEEAEPIPYVPQEKTKTKNKGNMGIVEKDGELVITLKEFTIVIRPN